MIAKVGEVAYKLQLPATARVHPVFHVSLLKRSIKPGVVAAGLPPGLEVADVYPLEPEAILASREGKSKALEWLILWKSRPVEDASWESAPSIRARFPSFGLEDKANFPGSGIDRNLVKPFRLYYSRRPKRPNETLHAS